ncbi:site-2 protease family protein [Ruania alba]|uniref:Zn-dependent protease (Includes SpoIVFB) n=1 Tax=Ruania alba TaxID=648782 RepID=A0A1H5GMP9_9MICO|nr:site-2 protease family protein [Ruania alba]SEE16890.1 Zn-dependent protease (includes SpoIVFB) [Ruania alba]
MPETPQNPPRRPAAARPGRSTTRGWRIGTLDGAPVIVTAGWLLIAAVLVALVGPQLQARLDAGPVAYLWALAVPALLFVSVLAHELAHGFAARSRKVPVREYVITLWGGHTSFTSGLRTPADSAIVSVAGPAANLALAGIGWFLGDGLPGLPGLAMAAFTYTNAFVGVFNLLPALPLDGGKLLEAAIWAIRSDRITGTLVAARAGQVLAVVILVGSIGWPLLQGQRPSVLTAVWAALVAGVLWTGAQGALRQAQAQQRARDVDLDRLATGAHVLPTSGTVADADRVLAATPSVGIVLVDGKGRPTALVDRRALAQVPGQGRDQVPLSAVAHTVPPAALVTQTRGPEAVAQVARAAQAGAAVVILIGLAGQGQGTGRAQVLGLVPIAQVVHLLGGPRA